MARSVWPPSYGRSKPFINRHITAGGPSLLIIYPRRFTSIDFSLHKFSAAFRTFPKYCAYVGNAPLGAELMRGMNCAAGKRGQFQCKTGQVSPQRTCAVSLAATVIVAETKNDGVAAAIAQKAIYGKWVRQEKSWGLSRLDMLQSPNRELGTLDAPLILQHYGRPLPTAF